MGREVEEERERDSVIIDDTNILHVTHVSGSCHTYEWVMSHI